MLWWVSQPQDWQLWKWVKGPTRLGTSRCPATGSLHVLGLPHAKQSGPVSCSVWLSFRGRGLKERLTVKMSGTLPKLCQELWPPVRNHMPGEITEEKHMIQHCLSGLLWWGSLPQRDEISHFRESVHHDENGGVTLGGGLSSKESHWNVLPESTWHREQTGWPDNKM